MAQSRMAEAGPQQMAQVGSLQVAAWASAGQGGGTQVGGAKMDAQGHVCEFEQQIEDGGG